MCGRRPYIFISVLRAPISLTLWEASGDEHRFSTGRARVSVVSSSRAAATRRPPREAVDPDRQHTAGAALGPVQTNPGAVVPALVTAGTGGSRGTGGTGGGAPPATGRPPRRRPRRRRASRRAACTHDGHGDGQHRPHRRLQGQQRHASAGTTAATAAGSPTRAPPPTLTNQMTDGVPELPTIGGVTNGRGPCACGAWPPTPPTATAPRRRSPSRPTRASATTPRPTGASSSNPGPGGHARLRAGAHRQRARAERATPDAPVGGHYRFLVTSPTAPPPSRR